jgi:hypothetical protein
MSERNVSRRSSGPVAAVSVMVIAGIAYLALS